MEILVAEERVQAEPPVVESIVIKFPAAPSKNAPEPAVKVVVVPAVKRMFFVPPPVTAMSLNVPEPVNITIPAPPVVITRLL